MRASDFLFFNSHKDIVDDSARFKDAPENAGKDFTFSGEPPGNVAYKGIVGFYFKNIAIVNHVESYGKYDNRKTKIDGISEEKTIHAYSDKAGEAKADKGHGGFLADFALGEFSSSYQDVAFGNAGTQGFVNIFET